MSDAVLNSNSIRAGNRMMTCPWCKAEIEDEYWFCDQCGKEIQVCPRCGKPGKGKACIYDGSTLVKASEFKGLSSGQAGIGVKSAPVVSVVTQVGVSELHLINRNLGLDLVIQDQDIIGRAEGRFAGIFSPYKRVSRRHCHFKFDAKSGWMVSDLGSTNGTIYENTPIKPNEFMVLKNGTRLIIGNIEFYVEIRQSGDQTER